MKARAHEVQLTRGRQESLNYSTVVRGVYFAYGGARTAAKAPKESTELIIVLTLRR